MTTEFTPRPVKCFWCGREFIPDSHNYAHVGGHGEVPGCDECLDLKPLPCDKCGTTSTTIAIPEGNRIRHLCFLHMMEAHHDSKVGQAVAKV